MKHRHFILKNESFKDYYLNEETEPIEHIPNFNRINIIVGANNSGKSRFMRFLMNQQEIELVDKDLYSQYNKLLNDYMSMGYGFGGNHLLTLSLNKNIRLLHNQIMNVLKGERIGVAKTLESQLRHIRETLIIDLKPPKKYYIPTLRTAHSLYLIEEEGVIKRIGHNTSGRPNQYRKITKDIYLQTVEKYYDIHLDVEIFTGLGLYKEILNSRNSEKKIRNRFEDFEKFLSANFFDGKHIDVVAKFNKDENEQGKSDSELILIHVEGEYETRKLYELGDGIQSIIILMYKIFMAENDSFIYIDEPELHLHPGMQRLFVEQICTNRVLQDKNLTYIINTHSNHLLDLTIEKDDVSIYTFSPRNSDDGEKKFIIRNVNSGDNTLLKHLGVNNSSVFMANCSIWVEGVSDRNYIKAFLKSYLSYLLKSDGDKFRSIKEDIDYAFFEYAGSNIDHYVFNKINYEDDELVINEIKALSLNNRIFLLADSDLADGRTSKGKRLKKIEDSASDNFVPKIIWEVREIENLLTNYIWEKVLIEFCHKRVVSKHSEVIQEKIKDALNEVDYLKFSKDYIGTFLNEIHIRLDKHDGYKVLNESIYEKKSDGFGTFVHKRELSELVFNADFPWEVFSKNPKIVELTEQVYKFIIYES